MRVKKNRAVKKTCKTCCFKYGIKCTSFGYSEYFEDCDNKVDIFWWINEDWLWYLQSRKNYLKMHRDYAKEFFKKKMHDDMLWRTFWQ